MDRLIYSVNVGGYDVMPPLLRSTGFRHVCFTDNPANVAPGWEVIQVEPWSDPAAQSRYLKTCPHHFIDAEVYIYLDGNQQIIQDLAFFLSYFFKGGFLAVRHPNRNCLFDEARRVIELKRANKDDVLTQANTYEAAGMPTNWGLFANGFFVRDRTFNDFCDLWWQELQEHTKRDQISLPYLVWQHEIPLTAVEWLTKENYVKLLPHKNGSIAPEIPKIWHFVPGAGDKNLGKVLNEHCALVPSQDDWICIRDNDTCYLAPHINRQIEDIINKNGSGYDLLSCYTNRLGLEHQLPYGLMTEKNMTKLQALAMKHFKDQYDEVIPSPAPTAGLFMLFPKRTWLKHKFAEGLAEGTEFIDYQFSNGLLKKGMRIGICTGIFLFHYYRMHNKNVRDISHLKVGNEG